MFGLISCLPDRGHQVSRDQVSHKTHVLWTRIFTSNSPGKPGNVMECDSLKLVDTSLIYVENKRKRSRGERWKRMENCQTILNSLKSPILSKTPIEISSLCDVDY